MDEAEIPGGTQQYDREARLAAQEPIEALIPTTGEPGSLLTESEDGEPPVEVGMVVRIERGNKEVPVMVMAVYEDDVIDGIVFSMIGPAHVRPMERLMRTPPGNGGWWFDWEGRV